MSRERISEVYGLTRSQGSLDFVDVFDDADVEVYVDPQAIRLLDSEWAKECVYLVQDFFSTVLKAIGSGDLTTAKSLLLQLREPNEVRLGQSVGRPRGSALGDVLAGLVLDSLASSAAVQTGLLRDLEDTALMIEHVDRDRISDVTINIIREPLIAYTQRMCDRYGIPLQQGVESGPMWDPRGHEWYSESVELPVTSHDKLILVPKAIVRRQLSYNADQYYRHYIAPALQREEIERGSSLVELLANGTPRVTKEAIYEKYGSGKKAVVRETLIRPHLLADYRKAKVIERDGPLGHEQLSDRTGAPSPDFTKLLDNVLKVQPGFQGATAYHEAVESLLSALLYPSLVMPILEQEIHGGRKRIDISYTNVVADHTFFAWIANHYPASNVFVECKNISKDPNNPELDQLQGRFSPSRGKVGLLLYRQSSKKETIVQRCIDAAHDDRGFIIPIDDDDLRLLVQQRVDGVEDFGLLRERFNRLVL